MTRSRFSRPAVLGVVLALLAVFVFANALAAQGRARYGATTSGITPNDVAHPNDYYIVSFTGSGSVGPACLDPNGEMPYKRGDAILYEGPNDCWAPWFSATRSGLPTSADINALHDRCTPPFDICETYFSFKGPTDIPGAGTVRPQDVVMGVFDFNTVDAYTDFQVVFDGSDVGLSGTAERIDALHIFDPGDEPAGMDCARLFLISTAGNYRVDDAWGNPLTGGGEDVLGFCATWTGPDTAGWWFLYHDGSAEGLPHNALIGLNHEVGRKAFSRFEFLTSGPFHADAADGGPSEVFNFFGQTGQYGGPTFSFPAMTEATDVVDSLTVHED
jgi:hypothetical protein